MPKKGKRMSRLVLRNPTAFPDAMYVKFRWHQKRLYDGIGVESYLHYGLNNPYQPDSTQPGTQQPKGWDQWANFYNRYTCFSSSIYLRIVNLLTTAQFFLVLYPDTADDDVTTSNARDLPYAKSRILGQADGGHDISKMFSYFTVKRLEGNPPAYADNSYSALMTASPSVLRYWSLSFDSYDTSENFSCIIDVNIVYYCRLWLRKNIVDA